VGCYSRHRGRWPPRLVGDAVEVGSLVPLTDSLPATAVLRRRRSIGRMPAGEAHTDVITTSEWITFRPGALTMLEAQHTRRPLCSPGHPGSRGYFEVAIIIPACDQPILSTRI
jgi:hypothetical protein